MICSEIHTATQTPNCKTFEHLCKSILIGKTHKVWLNHFAYINYISFVKELISTKPIVEYFSLQRIQNMLINIAKLNLLKKKERSISMEQTNDNSRLIMLLECKLCIHLLQFELQSFCRIYL